MTQEKENGEKIYEQKTVKKMIDLSLTISIIALNINFLCTSIKNRNVLSEWNKQGPKCDVYQKLTSCMFQPFVFPADAYLYVLCLNTFQGDVQKNR